MKTIWLLFTVLGLTLLLAACGGGTVAKTETISCTGDYRGYLSGEIEREETITFTDVDDEQTIPFADLTFHAAYRNGAADNERSLRLWVTDPTTATLYHSTLFQLPLDEGPQNQFSGGHGFTGLNYSYRPDSNAELQYWCAVE